MADEAKGARPPDEFDHVVANLGQQWHDDGLGEAGAKWEDRPAFAKVAYLADFAGAMDVPFERFAAAARDLLGLELGQGFTPDQDWFMRGEYDRKREQYGHARLERVEGQLRALKSRTDFVEPANHEDLGNGFSLALGEASIGRSWDQLTEGQKLDQMARYTEVLSLRQPAKRDIIAREIDPVRLPEGLSVEPCGDVLPDFRADVLDAVMTRLEAFGDEFARQARTKQQKVLAEAFGELVGEVHTSIAYIAEASRQFGPPAGGLSKSLADGVTSPADLAESAAPAAQQHQQQTQGRSHSI